MKNIHILWALPLILVSAALTACNSCSRQPQPPVVPSAVPSEVVSVAPVPSTPPPPVQPPPAVLEVLPVSAKAGGPTGCLTMQSRAPGMPWNLPYPHQLVVSTTPPVDCGFFPALQAGGWRTAFCLEGNERKPAKLYLMTHGADIVVRINDSAPSTFLGACP